KAETTSRNAQDVEKKLSASRWQRKTKRPRNSGNDRFQILLEAKVAKMVCISLAPARLDRFPRGFTGHVAHPSRSIETRSRPSFDSCASARIDLSVFPSMSRASPRLHSRRHPSQLCLLCLARRSLGEGGSLIPSAPFSVFAGDTPAFTAEGRSPQG